MTQFNFVFKDQSGRIRYQGTSVDKLSESIVSSVTLTKTQANELAKYAYEEWKKLISAAHPSVSDSRTPWSSRDYRADLLAGISKSVSGSGISFKIDGDKALAAELGWGVPQWRPDWEDGIGKYAGGQVQDLRPWLLSDYVHVKNAWPKTMKEAEQDPSTWRTRSGANKYRVLRFDAPALSKIIETTAEYLTNHYAAAQAAQTGQNLREAERKKFKAEHVKALTHTARSSLDINDAGKIVFKPLSYSSVPPSENTHTYGSHMKWVYDRAALASTHLLKGAKDTKNDRRTLTNVIMHKAQFSVFRTITDSVDQKDAGLFFTKGIEPANTMEKLKNDVIPTAMANILSGKNPDGSERNGS